MNLNKKNIITIGITLIAGFLLGWILFGDSGSENTNEHQHAAAETEKETIWTCSMHPQIRQSEPGNCPICGMELIPLEEESGKAAPAEIRMSPTAMQLASVETQMVTKTISHKVVRLDGKVEADEREVYSQSTHIPGRIEKLAVNFTGQYVRKGSPLAYVYSPELVTAQEELFEAHNMKESQPELYSAAREKLKNWKLTDQQIDQIITLGTPQEQFPVLADVSGYVTEKMVNLGDYMNRGQTIYQIADLSTVWILFDVYESDIPWIKKGDKVTFSVASIPAKSFTGTISFIDPVIDPKTRVAKARVVTSNAKMTLKPEMFVSGQVEAGLSDGGKSIVVPRSAVMWTGKQSLVYVKKMTNGNVSFIMRKVVLGPDLGNGYIIEKGLEPGEEIAVHGTFSIDAAAQLSGRPSMMNPEEEDTDSDYAHVEMISKKIENMSGQTKAAATTGFKVPQAFKEQLTAFFNQYIKMKDAMVATDAAKTASEAKKALNDLENIKMELLKGDAHIFWMKNLNKMKETLISISNSNDIEKQRKAFIDFNPILHDKIKAFGLDGQTVYYQFCPMANDSKGAYWLSTEKNIRNPYYGEMMLECGEVRETLQ
jgi:Cu(I)/Ag(I) efflux system membrane fusion protein